MSIRFQINTLNLPLILVLVFYQKLKVICEMFRIHSIGITVNWQK